MNLVETILKAHSVTQRDKIVTYVGGDAKRFAEVVGVFLEGPYRVTQRVAWALSYCVERQPELIKPHLSRLLTHVTADGQHPAVRRNVMRLLQFVKIPVRLQGRAFAIAFRFLNDVSEPIAVRVFAMSVLKDLALANPDLRSEVIAAIEHHLPYASPAYRSRAMKSLKDLKK